ncbi:fatty acid desaturase [Thalassococcus sp. S3]|nr:fatty acid desaturase [Thalassococcus sp. S3]
MRIEWVTLGLITATYAGWAGALWLLPVWLAVPALIGLIALHASLTHEVLHGHPFRSKWGNEALMQLPLNLAIPYERFRDLHLAHHRNENLTDPYDDPETNYLDPAVWAAMPRWKQRLFALNNTLMGRILLGPAIGQAVFMADEWRLIRSGDHAVIRAWALHLAGAAVVLALVGAAGMPIWSYLIAAYGGLGLLRIRTFLEHQAHEKVRGRTVIIEDRGPLAFLFLNNNLHVVHHMHPKVAWYRLPTLYRANKDRYLARNDGYFFASYAEVFRRYLWRAKDPVPHPIWRPRAR